ncbi:GTPase ObgE [candidate division KSB1 bacterium RBG_16_48_16]|nr:MAG: GTPase ObgE [candidate division KSB1 bacterium RBG_16_48_16]
MFIDKAKITVKAGDGGSGCVAFRREKYVPKGGPSGGDGGRGGDIFVRADCHLRTLLDFKYQTRYKASRGQHGQGDNKTGKEGKDLVIRLPLGTVLRDASTGEVLADLTEDRQSEMIARGGRGGRGNARFATPTDRAPRTWEPGGVGEEKEVELELKLIADVGLVGLPNSGKSTLLSRLSHAKPKIADYPFTTLQPNLGIVKVAEGKSFVLADIPGIIEGAHVGRGLGLQFLRHIERTRVLAFLLDCSSENLQKDYEVLLGEIQSYGHDLINKQRMYIINKIDLLTDWDTPAIADLSPRDILSISAVRGDNLELLKIKLFELLSSNH